MRKLVRPIALLLIVAAAVAWWRRPVAALDDTFVPSVDRPTWVADGPAVLIDNAHWNGVTSVNGFVGFARLLTADGYRVLPDGNATRAEMLADARVGVVANPLGLSGLARTQADRVSLGHLAMFDDDGLMTQEMETTVQWVDNGGSLLIVADDGPPARGAAALAAMFGVEMRQRVVVDVGHSEPRAPERLVFSRENHLLGAHPIIDGWSNAPAVNRVVTFGGQALVVPEGATSLLTFSASAVDVPRLGSSPADGASVAELAHAVAIERGRGRVVVVGDSAVLTSGVGADGRTIGLSWPGADNQRFARYVMRWLSRRDDAAPSR